MASQTEDEIEVLLNLSRDQRILCDPSDPSYKGKYISKAALLQIVKAFGWRGSMDLLCSCLEPKRLKTTSRSEPGKAGGAI